MPDETRREFLDLAIKGGVALGATGMAVPVGLYLLPARSRGPKDLLIPAGSAVGFEPGTARLVHGEGRPILVIAEAGGRFRAFSAICTHLGCIVKWDGASGMIQCPCHAAVFGPDGRVVSGPPPRPLPEYEVVRTGDDLKVKV